MLVFFAATRLTYTIEAYPHDHQSGPQSRDRSSPHCQGNRSQGVPLEKLAERLLREALTAGLPPHVLTRDEFRHMLERIAEGSKKLPDLPTEGFSRDSFYEDRL